MWFAGRDLPDLARMYLRVGENGPLFYTLLHGWLLFVGHSDFAVRFASVMAGVLTVPLLYVLGARLFGRAVGLAAAALLAADPYHLWYSQEAKMYAAVAFVAVLSVWLLVDALRSDDWWRWIGWVAVLGAGFYLHFFVALLIAAEAAAVIVCWRRGVASARRGASLLFGLGLLYVPLGIWQLPLLMNGLATSYSPYAPDALVSILLAKFSVGIQYPSPTSTVLFAFLLAAGLTLSSPQDKQRSRALIAGWLILPIVLFLVVSLRISVFLDRYLIIILPAYVLLLGRGLIVILRRSTIAAAIVTVGILVFWAPEVVNPPLLKQDFKRAAAYLNEHVRENDVVVYLPSWERGYVEYYDPGLSGAAVLPSVDQLGLPAAASVASQLLDEANGTFWLVSVEPNYGDSQRQLQSWLDQHANLLDDVPLANLDLRHYRGPAH